MAPLIPPAVVYNDSSHSDSDFARPMSQDGVVAPAKIGPTRQRRASRVQAGMTSKRGCQCNFVAKQLYMDNTLCEIQYHGMNHFNRQGQPCHGSSFAGFRHSLGARLSWRTRNWIRSMLGQGFSPAQVMAFHKKEVWECAMENRPSSRDTFIMPDDVYNLCKKRATQLWQKHARDPLSVRMWKEENEESVFHYHEFGNINLNEAAPLATEEETPFCLGIQTPWQLDMMLRYGHHRQIAMDATFGTNEPKVRRITLSDHVFLPFDSGRQIVICCLGHLHACISLCFLTSCVPAVPIVHCHGLRRVGEWHPRCIHNCREIKGKGRPALAGEIKRPLSSFTTRLAPRFSNS